MPTTWLRLTACIALAAFVAANGVAAAHPCLHGRQAADGCPAGLAQDGCGDDVDTAGASATPEGDRDCASASGCPDCPGGPSQPKCPCPCGCACCNIAKTVCHAPAPAFPGLAACLGDVGAEPPPPYTSPSASRLMRPPRA